jgi:hypothetical protein
MIYVSCFIVELVKRQLHIVFPFVKVLSKFERLVHWFSSCIRSYFDQKKKKKKLYQILDQNALVNILRVRLLQVICFCCLVNFVFMYKYILAHFQEFQQQQK